MKGFWLSVSAVLFALSSSSALCQEMSVRRGVVTAMDPVQTSESSQESAMSSNKRRLGGLLGRAVGRVVGTKNQYYYDAVSTSESLGEELAVAGDSRGAGHPVNTMVMIRFDNGDETGIVRSNDKLRGLRVGRRVKVIGSGSSAMIMAN